MGLKYAFVNVSSAHHGPCWGRTSLPCSWWARVLLVSGSRRKSAAIKCVRLGGGWLERPIRSPRPSTKALHRAFGLTSPSKHADTLRPQRSPCTHKDPCLHMHSSLHREAQVYTALEMEMGVCFGVRAAPCHFKSADGEMEVDAAVTWDALEHALEETQAVESSGSLTTATVRFPTTVIHCGSCRDEGRSLLSVCKLWNDPVQEIVYENVWRGRRQASGVVVRLSMTRFDRTAAVILLSSHVEVLAPPWFLRTARASMGAFSTSSDDRSESAPPPVTVPDFLHGFRTQRWASSTFRRVSTTITPSFRQCSHFEVLVRPEIPDAERFTLFLCTDGSLTPLIDRASRIGRLSPRTPHAEYARLRCVPDPRGGLAARAAPVRVNGSSGHLALLH
ncbi:hypothetical protein B0H11DRAFT_2214141 [Mycena galericulata]|nr:hypothetical protein B0H11DRAFT_2214141 [Mycena galericulata]